MRQIVQCTSFLKLVYSGQNGRRKSRTTRIGKAGTTVMISTQRCPLPQSAMRPEFIAPIIYIIFFAVLFSFGTLCLLAQDASLRQQTDLFAAPRNRLLIALTKLKLKYFKEKTTAKLKINNIPIL